MGKKANRLVSIVVTVSLLLLGLLISPSPIFTENAEAALEHVFDKYGIPPIPTGIGDNVYKNMLLAQSFRASDNYRLTKIELLLQDIGLTNDSVSLDLRIDEGGFPGNTYAFANATGPPGWEWVTFEFTSSTPIYITALQTYWIVLINEQSQQNNGYKWAKHTIDPLYPDGTAAECPGSGCTSWNLNPGQDFFFIVYGISGPSISPYAEVSSPFAGRGDPLNFTVHFDNKGSEYASIVWINMTLSPHLTYESDDAALIGGVKSSLDWTFFDVSIAPHSFQITLRVSMNVTDLSPLTAYFTLQYANRFNVLQETHNFNASSIARVPAISFSKTVFPIRADKNESLSFNLTFVNSGSRPADIVWINDTLPIYVNYNFDTADNGTGIGNTSGLNQSRIIQNNTIMYVFINVTPGTYTFDINVTIKDNVLNGTVITNIASLYYTDSSLHVIGPIWASATARTPGASVQIKVEIFQNYAEPGDILTFKLNFKNEGNAPSAFVWLNATLSQGLTYISDTASNIPNLIGNPSLMHYEFYNILDGNSYTFNILASVGQNVVDGQILALHACLNFTDWDFSLLVPSCDDMSIVVRIPIIITYVQGPQLADPGDSINYDIVINNIGSGTSAFVGVKISESPDITFKIDNATLPGGPCSRTGLQTWLCPSVGPGILFLGFTYKLANNLPDGHLVISSFEINYTDSKGRIIGLNQTTVVTTVTSPIFTLEVLQDRDTVSPGETITYTIHFNNTGNGTAANVWINDTIPGNSMFRNSSEIYIGSSGTLFIWRFIDVAPGPHNFTVTITVDSTVKEGDNLTNEVKLSYQDANGQTVGNLRTYTYAEATDNIPDGSTDKEPDYLGLAVLLLVFFIVLLLALWLFMANRFYGFGAKNKAKIDELFLLHRSGELFRHHSRSLRPDIDSDVLSAMLVAVQNFVKESFNFRPGDLEELKFGDNKIILINGEYAILAAVVSGVFPQRLVPRMRKALAEIENRFGKTLDDWSGLTEDLPKIDDILSNLFGENAGK